MCTQTPSATPLSTSPTCSLSSFLASSGRKVFTIRGDGNCLFRSLSHQLLNTQDEHHFIRSTLVRFENLNQSVFTKYLNPPVTATTVSEHKQRMLLPQTWGTHLEVIAAAAFFRVPVYYTRATQIGRYRWECREPLPITGLRFPEVVNAPPNDQCPITHFELAYMVNTHYDSIVTTTTGRPSQEHPHIPTTVIDMTDMVL